MHEAAEKIKQIFKGHRNLRAELINAQPVDDGGLHLQYSIMDQNGLVEFTQCNHNIENFSLVITGRNRKYKDIETGDELVDYQHNVVKQVPHENTDHAIKHIKSLLEKAHFTFTEVHYQQPAFKAYVNSDNKDQNDLKKNSPKKS